MNLNREMKNIYIRHHQHYVLRTRCSSTLWKMFFAKPYKCFFLLKNPYKLYSIFVLFQEVNVFIISIGFSSEQNIWKCGSAVMYDDDDASAAASFLVLFYLLNLFVLALHICFRFFFVSTVPRAIICVRHASHINCHSIIILNKMLMTQLF